MGELPKDSAVIRVLEHARWWKIRMCDDDPSVGDWIRLLQAEPTLEVADRRALRGALLGVWVPDALSRTLSMSTLLEHAAARVSCRGGGIRIVDLVHVVIRAAGYPTRTAAPVDEVRLIEPGSEQPQASSRLASHDTPTLDEFGRDLTAAARRGGLRPLVGRDEELSLVIETLCRRIKPNPIVVGPPGAGKTAIIEGLAQRIVRGEVPVHMRDCRLVEIQPSSIVAGVDVVGEMERRMKAVIEEATDSNTILFIDEAHSAVGIGRGRGDDTDVAALLKPALARPPLRVIGATTPGEYTRYIARDAALARRFHRIDLRAPSRSETWAILRSMRETTRRESGIDIPEDVAERLLRLAEKYLPHRNRPDRELDLWESAVAYALAYGHASLSVEVVERVAARQIGMPLDLQSSLGALQDDLVQRGLAAPEEAHRLVGRLAAWAGGSDDRPRAAAVVVCRERWEGRGHAVAEAVARSVYGEANRVIRLLCGQDALESVAALRDQLQRLAQTPWSVLYLDGVDRASPIAQDEISRSLTAGELSTDLPHPLTLSSAVLVLGASERQGRPIGFRSENDVSTVSLPAALRAFRKHIDVVLG